MNTFTFSAASLRNKGGPFDGMMREARERQASAFSLVGKETLRVILKVKVFYVRSPC